MRILWAEAARSNPILSESDSILSDASHIVKIEWCSLLPRQFLFTEARPACNQSRQTSTSCDLMSSWKSPSQHYPLACGHFLMPGITPCLRRIFGFGVAVSNRHIQMADALERAASCILHIWDWLKFQLTCIESIQEEKYGSPTVLQRVFYAAC